MTDRQRDGAVIVALGLLSLGLFWNARIGIPRADQLYFLKEHDRLTSGWDFFWNAVSYNRANSRVTLIGTGDHFLFRPLFGAILAAVEIAGRGSLLVAGLVGIGLHWLACTALYVVARAWTGRAIAAAGACLMTTELAGMDAVVWTHIDPYLAALALLAFGVGAIGGGHHARAAILLLLSAWIHEGALVALLVAAIAMGRRGFPFWMALATYVVADGVDLLVHPWSSVAHSFTEPVSGYFPGAAMLDALRVAGLALLGRVAPSTVDLRLIDSPWDRALWPIASLPDALTLPLGALAWALIATALVVATRASGARRTQGLALVAVWLSVPLSLVLLRFSVRSILYLGISTYYFYVLDYVAILLALWLAAGLRQSRATGALAWALCLGMALPAATRIHALLRDRAPFVGDVRDVARAITRDLPAGTCYGGSLDDALRAFHPTTAPFVLVGDAACAGDDRRPVYLRARDGGYALVALSDARTVDPPTATEIETELREVDGATFAATAIDAGSVSLRYERGSWMLDPGGASVWHVTADGGARVGFRKIADHWYAVVDDRVLSRVPAIDPARAEGSAILYAARETASEIPFARGP